MYIDPEYLENMVSPEALSGAVLYGGTAVTNTGSVIVQFLESASDYVDSFLEPGGYSVPLSTVPGIIKDITALKAWEGLLVRANRPIPEEIRNALDGNEGYLLGIKDGRILLPRNSPDSATGPGGHSFGQAGSGSNESFFNLGAIRGTFV